MLLLYVAGVDRTANLRESTVRITEQLNNRADTLAFAVDDLHVAEGSVVEIWDVVELRAAASSGAAVLTVDDTHEFEAKFLHGAIITLDVHGSAPQDYVVDSVDHDTNEVTLTTNLADSYAYGTRCGMLLYTGITQAAPKEDIGVLSGKYSQTVNCTDMASVAEWKNVVETFLQMYSREIIGRIVFVYCANSDETLLHNFESAWTEGGTGRAMSDDTDDKVIGNKSQQTGVTGAGTATWTKTLGAPVDASGMDNVRLWWKTSEGSGDTVTALRYRIGNDSSNFLEWTTDLQGIEYEDCWNFDSFRIADGVETGTVDLEAIDWLQIEVVATASLASGSIKFDQSLVSFEGFTIKHVQRGKFFPSVNVSYKKPTVVIEELAKVQQWFWYVDTMRDFHFFASDTKPAPFSITETSQNFYDLTTKVDIAQLINQQTVRGGEAPAETLYTQQEVTDGVKESWALDYKPKDLRIYVDDGGGFTEKTVGVENLVDASTVEYLFNFQEKVVRLSTDTKPADGYTMKFVYYPFQQVNVTVQDPDSIDALKAIVGGDGIRDGTVILDASLNSFEMVRDRANAEVQARKNGVVNVDFKTEQAGLHAGQLIMVDLPGRGVSDSFLIQRVSASSRFGSRMEYTVNAASSLFGLIEFFQLLLKKSAPSEIDISEIIDKTILVNARIGMAVEYTFTKKDKAVEAGDSIEAWQDFILQTGTKTSNGRVGVTTNMSNWYAAFTGGESGSVAFDDASNYSSDHALKLTAATGGSGKEVSAKLYRRERCNPGAVMTVQAWPEIHTALTNVGTGGGAILELLEYADAFGGSPLATHTIFGPLTEAQDFDMESISFTTDASAAYYALKLRLYQAAGTVSLGAVHVFDDTGDSILIPCIADFSQAT